jgi:hypothetical protein
MSTAHSARWTARGTTWAARLTGIGMVVAVLGGMAGTPAHANLVSANEEVGCDGGPICDTDSFEIKCTQVSSTLCVWVEHNNNLDYTLMASVVATAPAAMFGQAGIAVIPLGSDHSFCLAAPAKDAFIKAILSVTLTPFVNIGQKSYHIEAQCFTGDIISGLVGRQTTIKTRHDE